MQCVKVNIVKYKLFMVLLSLVANDLTSCGWSVFFEPSSVLSLNLHKNESKSVTLLIGRTNCNDAIQFQIENRRLIKGPAFTFNLIQ
jgi:hypothetical protein